MMWQRMIAGCLLASLSLAARAHDGAQVRYIANEGVLVTSGETKIMFDPLPLSGFGAYMDVPDQVRGDMMVGMPPYDGVDVVFISHAHRDHFSAGDMIAYMLSNPDVHLVAPQQAVKMMTTDFAWEEPLRANITAIDMDADTAPQTFKIGDVEAAAVRIPHSGWPHPSRASVQNMVYRVTVGDGATVMHMGDADVNLRHYTPHKDHWAARRTDAAFPPYWFLPSVQGKDILYNHMNVAEAIGTHVPLRVPGELIASGADYFSISGEVRNITGTNPPESGCAPVMFKAQKYTVCDVSSTADIRLFWGKNDTPYGNFAKVDKALAEQGERLALGMNGGMYHKDRRPVGLYVEDWEKHQNLSTKPGPGNFHMLPNGVFWMWQEDGMQGFHVRSTDVYRKAAYDVVRFATQSGPMLVIDGNLHPKFKKDSTSTKRRNGVGISGDGSRLYFVISEEPVNFYNFASLFKDHLKTPNALYLDGTISRLHDPKNERSDPGLAMGPIIGVVEPLTAK